MRVAFEVGVRGKVSSQVRHEVLQLAAFAIEHPWQAKKLFSGDVFNFALLPDRILVAEAMRQEVVRRNAELATCQGHLPIRIARRLASMSCPAVLARYVRGGLRWRNGHQRARRRAVILHAAVVAALTLLPLAEWRIAHFLA